MDVLHRELLGKSPSFADFPLFCKILPRGKFKKKDSTSETCWLSDFC